jgi:hypothetical protein
LRLQERHHIFEFVVYASRRLFFLFTQEGAEFQQVSAFDVFEIELRARLREVVQRGGVGRQSFRLLRELGFLQELSDCRGDRSLPVLPVFGNDTDAVVEGVEFGFFPQASGCQPEGGQVTPLRPLLRTVQNAQNLNNIADNTIHNDVWQRGKHKLTRPLFLARTPAIRKRQQRLRSFVDGANKLRRVLRCLLKQIVRNAFEVGSGFFSPAQLHLAARLLFGNQLFKMDTHFFVG